MWYLAIKHLMSRPGQTVILLAGIMLGSAGYVMFSGLQTGQEEFMIDRLVNVSGCVTISPRERFITPGTFESYFFTGSLVRWLSPPSGRKDRRYLDNPAAWYRRLASDPAVLSYAPRYTINAILRKGAVSRSVTLNGVEPESQSRVPIARGTSAGESPRWAGAVPLLVTRSSARGHGQTSRAGRFTVVGGTVGLPVKVTACSTPALHAWTVSLHLALPTAQRSASPPGASRRHRGGEGRLRSEAVSALSLPATTRSKAGPRRRTKTSFQLNTQRA